MSIKQEMIDLNEKMDKMEKDTQRERKCKEIKEEIDYLCQIIGKIF
jgi:hypothetical protein